MTENGKTDTALFVSENGMVRVLYRTVMTAEDDFKRSFLAGVLVADKSSVRVHLEEISRFCIETFCTTMELNKGTVDAPVWEGQSFTWDSLKKMTGKYAEGGWAAVLGLEIYNGVVKKKDDDVAAQKKTSAPVSETSSSESTPRESTPAASPTSS